MSYFMVSIDFAGLSDRPPESKVIALADDRDAPLGPCRGVAQHDEAGLLGAAARHGETPRQAFARHAVRSPDLGVQRGRAGRELLRARGQEERRGHRRRLVHQVAGAEDAGSEARDIREERASLGRRRQRLAHDARATPPSRAAARAVAIEAVAGQEEAEREIGQRERSRPVGPQPDDHATGAEPLGLAAGSCAKAQPGRGGAVVAETDQKGGRPLALVRQYIVGAAPELRGTGASLECAGERAAQGLDRLPYACPR